MSCVKRVCMVCLCCELFVVLVCALPGRLWLCVVVCVGVCVMCVILVTVCDDA